MSLPHKPTPTLDEVYTLDGAMKPEVEKDLEDQVEELDEDRLVHVLRPFLSTHAIKEEDWCHDSIF